MPFLFHQNMRDYGGGSAVRDVFFNANLGAIGAGTGPGYWAAGFTEITNAGTSRAALSALAQVVDPGLTSFLVFEVGTSALGRTEYLGIAWNNLTLNVQHAGQVMKNPMTRAWTAYPTAAAAFPANQRILLPAHGALAADSRGPAFIAGLAVGGPLHNNPFVLMFMHNMYWTGDGSSAFSSLNGMAIAICNALGGVYGGGAAPYAEVIIGGDFNVDPRNPKRPRGNPPIDLVARAAAGVGGVLPTTIGGNTYDFWLVSNAGIGAANAFVHGQTQFIPGGSDHSGIQLVR